LTTRATRTAIASKGAIASEDCFVDAQFPVAENPAALAHSAFSTGSAGTADESVVATVAAIATIARDNRIGKETTARQGGGSRIIDRAARGRTRICTSRPGITIEAVTAPGFIPEKADVFGIEDASVRDSAS
jgi:hypothetical protein